MSNCAGAKGLLVTINLTMPSSLLAAWLSDPLGKSTPAPSPTPSQDQATEHSQQSLHISAYDLTVLLRN